MIIGFVGLATLGFLISDAVRSGSPFWAEARNQIGKIAGEKISYQEFSEQVQQSTNQMMSSTGQTSLTPQITSYAVQQVWRTMLERTIYTRELDKLGLATGPEELARALTGDEPHPIARQAFSNPQTGQYSADFALNIYKNRAMMPLEQQQFLLELEQRVQLANTVEKYIDMVSAGIYITDLEMQNYYEANQKTASVSFVKLPYASVPDSSVTVGEADLKNYYEQHKYQYRQDDELRSFDYVSFDILPSAKDTLAAREDIERLAEGFRTTRNDSLFYFSNAETKEPLTYRKRSELSPVLDTTLFDASPGTVYGPYFEDGRFKVAKLLDAAALPDSVRASHLLVSAASTPDPQARQGIIDSLRQLITSGKASFEELARKHSADSLSGREGGDLGYFAQGQMVPSFETAAFFGKTGDLKVVETQFGTHLLKITGQKNSSRKVKIAVVDILLEPSQESNRAAYAQANAFVSSLSGNGDFDAKAEEAGLVKRVAENVNAIDFFVPGLANPREVIRWAFEAEVSDVSPLFDLNDRYVVARLTQIKPEGYPPLSIVRSEVEQEVRQLKKGEQLAEQMKEAFGGTSDLAAAAQKLGDSLSTVQNVTFSNPMISGAGYEPELVGAVFGSEPGKIGGPVKGMTGVFGFSVQHFSDPAPITDPAETKEALGNRVRQQYMGFLFEALQDKTKVIDHRAKFY